MDFDQFFEKFLNDDIATLSEEIVTFFNQPLTPEVLEEYPVHMLVTEFLGHHEDAGDFEAIEELQQVLIDHNSDFFQEVKGFFVNYLVKYYCFKQDAEKVERYLKLYLDGYEDYDLLLLTMHEALFYGHTTIVNELIEGLYEKVENDHTLVEGALIDFILFKFSIELEKTYHQYQQTSAEPDWGALQEKMAQYDFDLKQDFLEVIKGGMLHSGENVSQEFLSSFPIHKQPILGALQIIFMKYIHGKGCSFVLSAMIWNDLGAYWTNRKSSNWTQFFDIEKDSFIEFARSKGGMMMDYRNRIALLVWGSAYVIEFLRAIQLYNEETYQQQMAKVASIKQEFKEAYNIDLWQYSFVWQWEPLVGEDIEKEKALFADSFALTSEDSNQKFFGKETALQDDLANIYGGSEMPELDFSRAPAPKSKPTRRKHNYSRNQRVNVRYNDGTVKENVKFKTIQDDFELGECEVV